MDAEERIFGVYIYIYIYYKSQLFVVVSLGRQYRLLQAVL